jgi:hypothetical protein
VVWSYDAASENSEAHLLERQSSSPSDFSLSPYVTVHVRGSFARTNPTRRR